MKLDNNIKYLIIARREYHKILYSLKEKNPSLDFNIVSPPMLYNLASFSVNDEAISFLLTKEKYDFNNIRNILSIINKADLSKNKELNSLFLELEKNGFINKDELFNIELKRKEVVVFEEKENRELFSFLDRNNIKYSSLSFEDLNLKENKEYNPLIFDNKLNQFFYLFSSIRSKIINEKVNPNDISILTTDENDLFYLKFCSDVFNIDVDISSYSSLRNDPEINEFIASSFKNKRFDINSIQNDTLKNIFSKYHLDKIKDFDFALLNLYEILSSLKVKNELSTGIKVTSSFDISTEIVYITNFQYDVFYKVYQYSGYFNDVELSNMSLNPSYIKTLVDKEFKLNFLKYSKIELLSRCLSSISEKIYPSQFTEEWNIKYISTRFNETGLYTSKALKIIQSIDKDLYSYKEDKEYRSYSNKYQKISTDILNPADLFEKFSPSLLKGYFTCPFSFYLENILLTKSEFTSNENTYLGELLHLIFENNYKDISGLIEEEDFESLFDDSLKILKDKNPALDSKIERTLLLSKDHIKAFYLSSLRHKFNNRNILSEEKDNIEKTIDTYKLVGGNEYKLKGRADKVLFIESEGTKYYVIIDYKSSTHDYFDYQLVPFGGSLQLPFYYLGLSEVYENKGYEFGGFFIHNIFNKHCIKPKDNKPTICNYFYRLSGLYYYDINFVKAFDQGLINGDNIIGKNCERNYVNCHNYFTPITGSNQINKHVHYSFSKLVDDSTKAIANTALSIYDNNFEIAPKIKSQKESPSCTYCQYKDICYRRHDDIKNLEEDIRKIFGVSEEEFDEEINT